MFRLGRAWCCLKPPARRRAERVGKEKLDAHENGKRFAILTSHNRAADVVSEGHKEYPPIPGRRREGRASHSPPPVRIRPLEPVAPADRIELLVLRSRSQTPVPFGRSDCPWGSTNGRRFTPAVIFFYLTFWRGLPILRASPSLSEPIISPMGKPEPRGLDPFRFFFCHSALS
jgi:hypothetical protein